MSSCRATNAKRKHTAKAVDAFLERDRLRDELAALVAA